jgi:hypothetical protein
MFEGVRLRGPKLPLFLDTNEVSSQGVKIGGCFEDQLEIVFL